MEEHRESVEFEDSPELQPKQKKPRTVTITEEPGTAAATTTTSGINYLAYEVETTHVKILRELLISQQIAKMALIIRSSNTTGILMNFKDWKQVAHFHEWCSKGKHTQQLTTMLRVPCGTIACDAPAHYEASDLIEKLAAAQTVNRRDLDTEYEEDTARTAEDGFPTFSQYLVNGVFCVYCNEAHKTAVFKF